MNVLLQLGIGSLDTKADTFDVFRHDCDPRHATTIIGA
jgi:hypothetical protein